MPRISLIAAIVLLVGHSLTFATGNAGYRVGAYSYTNDAGESVTRLLHVWYPIDSPAKSHKYIFQEGSATFFGSVAKGRHPLILFSHGYLGVGDQSIFLTEKWARAGYIVACPNHADSMTRDWSKKHPAPQFGDFEQWTHKKYWDRREDMVALLDHMLAEDRNGWSPFHRRIDRDKIAVAGHSLGGYTALGLVGAWKEWRDPRFQAALAMSPFAQPFLDERANLRAIQTPVMLQGGTLDLPITPSLGPIYDHLGGTKYFLNLEAENHFGWTNLASLGKTTQQTIQQGNPQWMAEYSVAFFHRHLRDQHSPILARPNTQLRRYQFREK